MRRIAPFLTAACAFALVGCSAFDTKAAEEAVTVFHKRLDAGKLDAVYGDTSQEFRKVTTRESFSQLLAAISRKLGKTKNSKMVGWNVNTTTGGSFATLTYETNFERGLATETFNFRYAGKKPLMLGYNVNSPALITN